MPTASWNQLERTIEQLHARARSALSAREFYRRLIAEAIAALDAAGGAAWRPGAAGAPSAELLFESLPDGGVAADWSGRRAIVERTLLDGVATIVPHDAERDLLVCPVEQPVQQAVEPPLEQPVEQLLEQSADARAAPRADRARFAAVIELWMPAGASPPVRQGWLDFAAALADVAADFHARDELRRLRAASALREQSLGLVRRVSAPRTLEAAAFELANEGRRLLPCDRVTVLVRSGRRWRLAAISGVDSAERRTELARRSEQLADQIARWGEPLESGAGIDPADEGADQLPPQLAAALAQHLDHSHARMLAAVPVAFPPNSPPGAAHPPRSPQWDVVLIAERFHAGPPLRDALVELGELVAPAVARTAALDRFPIRTLLRWSEGLAPLRRPAGLLRIVAVPALLAGAAAALLLIPAEFVVEAPAHLAAAVERDIFATATGSVAEVHVVHGQQVRRGDVLLVLADPELALQVQANRGEIAAARKRLAALAISRTDRSVPENAQNDRLPLAAEQRELEERLASLLREQSLLDARGEALTLRSPRDGQVITPDVQSLLVSRPVERGQSLLTIADSSAGWELHADVPQRHIGHVMAARDPTTAPLPVDFRLAGDVEALHPAHVVEISAAAPLDATGLRDQAAPVQVRMAVDGTPPAAIRTGMSATVRIRCGQRSLGYVWLHDALATLYRWATF